MNKKFVLKDGTAFAIEAGSSIRNLMSIFKGRAEMVAVWDKLTNENLKECRVEADDGTVTGSYANFKLSKPEVDAYTNTDGTVTAAFHFEQKTDLELRVDNIEEQQVTQDGAIGDLGEAVSNIAEGGQA